MNPIKMTGISVIYTSLGWELTVQLRDKTTRGVIEGFDLWQIRAGLFAKVTDTEPLAVVAVAKDNATGILTLTLADTSGLSGAPLLVLLFKTSSEDGGRPLARGRVRVEATGVSWEALA